MPTRKQDPDQHRFGQDASASTAEQGRGNYGNTVESQETYEGCSFAGFRGGVLV